MRGHDKVHTLRDRINKRREFGLLKVEYGLIEHRNFSVRIRIGISVAREMFGRCKKTDVLTSTNVGANAAAHRRRILSKGPRGNNRIVRIGMNVRDGRERYLYPCGKSFSCDDSCGCLYIFPDYDLSRVRLVARFRCFSRVRIIACTLRFSEAETRGIKRHRMRENGRSAELLPSASLDICSDQ